MVILVTMVRSEWGIEGVRRLRPEVAVLVIVDVLSFSTAVDIATGRGAQIVPFPSGDRETAQDAANRAGAILAAPRKAGGGQVSLSPLTLFQLAAGTRLMLPSPNGSPLSVEAAPGPVLAGCFRNAGAVARAALALAGGEDIGVIPAGERWPDGSLRPAVEDSLGAGAVIHAPRPSDGRGSARRPRRLSRRRRRAGSNRPLQRVRTGVDRRRL